MQYQDKTLVCRDCGKNFVFTARDQEFFAEKGFTNAPTRCRDCRNQRKGTGGKPGSSQNDGERKLFKISCKKCGKVSEMATEPRKPDDVLCSECFYDAFKDKLATIKTSAPADEKEEATGGIYPTEE